MIPSLKDAYQFYVYKKVSFGSSYFVSGNIPSLGNWNIKEAKQLACDNNYEYCSATVLVSLLDTFEYKYFVAPSDLSFSCVQWDHGENLKPVFAKEKLEMAKQLMDSPNNWVVYSSSDSQREAYRIGNYPDHYSEKKNCGRSCYFCKQNFGIYCEKNEKNKFNIEELFFCENCSVYYKFENFSAEKEKLFSLDSVNLKEYEQHSSKCLICDQNLNYKIVNTRFCLESIVLDLCVNCGCGIKRESLILKYLKEFTPIYEIVNLKIKYYTCYYQTLFTDHGSSYIKWAKYDETVLD